jgi:hypothetical protein
MEVKEVSAMKRKWRGGFSGNELMQAKFAGQANCWGRARLGGGRGGLELADETQALQGEIGICGDGFGQAGDDPGGVATGSDEVDGAIWQLAAEGLE